MEHKSKNKPSHNSRNKEQKQRILGLIKEKIMIADQVMPMNY